MRDLINILNEASRIDPSPSAIKFWITEQGEIKMIGGTHHFVYIMANSMTWGEVFDKGWVRGFFEQKTNLICFEFDQRKITRGSRRTMLKLTRDFDVLTVMWDDNRHGSAYGSERLSVEEFHESLRYLLTEDHGEELYWFWFNAETNYIHHIEDGTHTLAAIEELNIPGMEDIEEYDSLEDSDVLTLAMQNNWVRGRYDDNQLMLQGRRLNVRKCARWVADRFPIDVLYVDFIESSMDTVEQTSFDKKPSAALRGARLEFFLNKGWIPTSMISEGVFKVSIGGGEFRIWENPTRAQIDKSQIDEFRGIIDDLGDLYVWDAYNATHDRVAKELGIVIEYRFNVMGEYVRGADVEHLIENKYFLRAFGKVKDAHTDLCEGVFKISAGGSFQEFKMWENPTPRQVDNLMYSVDEVRGLIDDKGDLYVWDAYEATHHAVAKELGLVINHQFSVSGDILTGDTVEALNDNKNFTRAFGTELKNGFDDDDLMEAPISDISHIGDWDRNSSFRHPQDRKLLTNPKAVTKIKAMWKYPDYVDYNIILINNTEANNWTEEGLVRSEVLKSMFPKTFSEIEPLLKDDQVNIIFTNNKGAARVPMTGWVMAHRFGHALFRGGKNYYFKEAVEVIERYMKELMDDYGVRPNGPQWDRSTPALSSTTARNIAHAICTFKSARDKKLRTTFEMVHELFAQYVINGTVKFNPPPRSVKVGNTTYPYRYDDEQYERTSDSIVYDMPMEINPYFDAAIHTVVGKVLVM